MRSKIKSKTFWKTEKKKNKKRASRNIRRYFYFLLKK